MAFKKRWVAPIVIVWIIGLSPAEQASDKNNVSSDAKIDYISTKQDILKFEAVINDVINSTFSSGFFAVVQSAKGAYLEGYGINFAFLINIHRAVVNTPFGQIRALTASASEIKKRRIEELKEKLIRVLQENGDIFRQLRKEDHVTIIAFFEDRNFPDESSVNKTIVLTTLKKDLDELGHRNDRLKEFKQRMKIVEY